MFKKRILLFLMIFCCTSYSFAGDLDLLKKKKSGVNVKILPAFFWGTFGLSGEIPISEKFTANINLLGTLGRLDGKNANYSTRPESYMSEGWRAEAMFRYYIKGEAPTGFYAHLNFAYNNLFYYDGNTRPYTLVNNWRETNGVRLPSNFEKPNPISAGLGIGYQLEIIPDLIIVDAFCTLQGHMDANGDPFLQVYVAPSIGYKF